VSLPVSTTTRAEDFDPLSTDDPAAIRQVYRELQEWTPLAWTNAYGGHWALTRHDDVRRVASDSRTFISSVRAVVPSDPRGLRRPPLNYDAPLHTPYRRALDRTLQRRRIERLADPLREHAREALQPLLDAGGGDIVTGFASLFPAWVTVEWLNLDAEEAPRLARTASEWVRAWRRQDAATVNARSEEMYQIARDIVADRSRHPRPVDEDPASSLLAERVDGQPLDPERIVGALRQSLVVGMVAPPIVLGAVFAQLGTDLSLQRTLRDRRETIPAAVDEFVRLHTPYRGFARTAAHPITLHDREVRPGEPITLVYAAANRDPAVFPDPDSFVLDRPNIAEHLGFGRGRHRCAGAPLAHLALCVAIEVLLETTESITAEPPTDFAQMPELGPTSLNVTLTPAR
jgi:cytochrome P450